jgi:hypothetical protein
MGGGKIRGHKESRRRVTAKNNKRRFSIRLFSSLTNPVHECFSALTSGTGSNPPGWKG